MAISEKVAAARKIESLLKSVLQHGGLRLRYRITVDPSLPEQREWERPQILVELSGPDQEMLLERNAELLRAFESLAIEILRLPSQDHDKVSFDAMGYRAARLHELRLAATVAAEKVRETGRPYEFGPMSSRERRVLHLALRDLPDLRTESDGDAGRRHVVVYPKDYQAPKRPAFARRR
ncbi:MAG: protein jag [Candidatus Korobacteraceae bacterium]